MCEATRSLLPIENKGSADVFSVIRRVSKAGGGPVGALQDTNESVKQADVYWKV